MRSEADVRRKLEQIRGEIYLTTQRNQELRFHILLGWKAH
jgi:hypothetical protein